MYQAGIKKITLVEDKGVEFNYYDPLDLSKISNLEYTGAAVIVEECQRPKFDIKIRPNNHGKIGQEYSVEFFLYAYSTENYDTIIQLQQSIYGWLMLVEFYDGTFKFYRNPVYWTEVDFKPHEEMSFPIKMQSKVPTELRHLEYTPGISTVPVYRADTTLLTADNTIYTADYSL